MREPTPTPATGEETTRQRIERLKSEPTTLKGVMTVIVVALALIGLGLAILKWPDLGLDPNSFGRARTAFWVRVITWVWSTPGAVTALVLGGLFLLIGAGSYNDYRKERAERLRIGAV